MNPRKLKERLRELKRIRTAVLMGLDKINKEEDVVREMDKIRLQLGAKNVRGEILKVEMVEGVGDEKPKKAQVVKMAKITVEQYKDYVESGLTLDKIMLLTGVKESTIKTYKHKWKQAGLLDDIDIKTDTKISDEIIAQRKNAVEGIVDLTQFVSGHLVVPKLEKK